MTVATLPATAPRSSLVQRFADRFQVDPSKLLSTLKQTAFRTEKPATDEQMMALLLVADSYSLNPWTKEIYAFEDKFKGIVPVVGVDGWSRIVNEHAQFDGMEFSEAEDGSWCECVMYRKDRQHPTRVREYLAECRRNTGPWQSHPRRMLRHKTMIQCARLAFGFAGIYDQDEAERIIEGSASVVSTVPPASSRTDQAKAALRAASPTPAPAAAPPEPEPEQAPQAHEGPAPADVDPETGEVLPHYDAAAAIAAVNACEAVADLNKLWPSIVLDFQQTGRELPIEVEGAHNDRREALAAKAQKRSRT